MDYLEELFPVIVFGIYFLFQFLKGINSDGNKRETDKDIPVRNDAQNSRDSLQEAREEAARKYVENLKKLRDETAENLKSRRSELERHDINVEDDDENSEDDFDETANEVFYDSPANGAEALFESSTDEILSEKKRKATLAETEKAPQASEVFDYSELLKKISDINSAVNDFPKAPANIGIEERVFPKQEIDSRKSGLGLNDGSDLRRAVIFAEIIAPPLALRKGDIFQLRN